MLTFYQKYYVHINLFLVIILGLSCGLLGGAWLDANMGWEENSSNRSVSQQLDKVKSFTPADVNSILQRNLFDPASRSNSATIDLGEDEDVTATESATAARNSANFNRTLLGTVVAGENSLALMQSEGEFVIFHLGEQLPDGGTIEEIFRNYIQIRERDKSLSEVEIVEDDNAKASRPVVKNASDTGEVKKIDDRHWIVPQKTAEATRENLPAELRLALMQPRITDGKTDGFIIRRLKRTSILNKLGLKRGDVILNINDIPLDGPESGLQVFQQLREARTINLAVERKGEAMTFTYELN
jgi:general secretion pathway protein C